MRSHAAKRFIALLLCLALLVRVVVPVGFMPDIEAMRHGTFTLRICTGMGPKEITVGHAQQHDKGHKTEQTNICLFAGLLGGALPVLGLVFTLLLLWSRLRFGRDNTYLLSAALASVWPRGPPLRLV